MDTIQSLLMESDTLTYDEAEYELYCQYIEHMNALAELEWQDRTNRPY